MTTRRSKKTNLVQPTGLSLVFGAIGVLVLLPACSAQKKALHEIENAFARKQYRETIALCRHSIRRNIESGEVYYYYGASLVMLGRDFEAFRRLDEAVTREPAIRQKSGRFLLDQGSKAFEEGNRATAGRRIRKALEIDPSCPIGGYAFLVGDSYYQDSEFARAAELYQTAIREFPDSSAVEEAYLNMANSYAEIGAASRSRESIETLLKRFPRTRFKTQARWKLANILYTEGEKQYVLGNYEQTVDMITAVLEQTRNPGLTQKSRFLLGETYEAMGDFENAYQQYRQIIRGDRGASGRIVERAREKITAMKEAGLY